MTGPRPQSRVVLHVGLPKSGTTFLQRSLADNAEALADRGVLYPQTPDDVMFRAALDVRGNHAVWGRRRKDVEGSWDALATRAHQHIGTTVVSQELLAATCQRRVDAALSLLKGLDVHVVVTARDPARQLVSEWQEGVKHGRVQGFAEFEVAVRSGTGHLATRYREAQDLPDVLDRWGRWLPTDHVHVVVGGPVGTDPRALWASFARVAGFDPDGFPASTGARANAALGVDEIDLLRRVNVALDGRLRQPAYGRLAKHRVAHELLSGGEANAPRPPLHLHDELVPLAERWVKEIDHAGYLVHGRLEDLVPAPPAQAPAPVHPDDADPGSQQGTAAKVIAELLLDLEAAQARADERDAKRRSWKKQAKLLRRKLAESI